MKQRYIDRNFSNESLALIDTMDDIVSDYVQQGYRLTVRQLYYQLVARAVVENTERSYKRITSIVNDAKLAGLMDWEAIEDRTREFIRRQRWQSASEILRASADSYHMDMWKGQPNRLFVIVEKEALAGVLEGVCQQYDVPLLAARGYPSGTVLREFAESDLIPCINGKQSPVILHLGDHDPSGIDMSRDLRERFGTFCAGKPGYQLPDKLFKRVALLMSQIEEQRPPPNPAKTTDARFESYRSVYGEESWELDALQPEYLNNLVLENIERFIVPKIWDRRRAEVEDARASITEVADNFDQAEG